MDRQSRTTKFSFSRPPEQSPKQVAQQRALQQLKNNFKCQMQLVINRNEQQPMDQQQEVDKLLERMNITLDEDDHKSIFFDFKLYQDRQHRYQEQQVLGEGCIGLVKSVLRLSDQKEFAVKIVKTDSEEIVKNMILEFKNLKLLHHVNIVKMEELYVNWIEGFQATGQVCIIMEKINGKEMFEVIQQQKHYSETTARVLFKQILDAIQYMHEHYVCHRDLKPNNILCSENGQYVKITDFNVSKFSDSYKEFGNLNEHGKIEMWTYTGTIAFSAPEIFSGGLYKQCNIQFSEQVDMWSAGVVLYVMLSGELPFNAEYLNDLIEQITNSQYDITGPLWNTISPQAKDLIQNLLQQDPMKRLTAQQAMNHLWIVKESSQTLLPRESLRRNMARLVSVRIQDTDKKIQQKMRQLCFLFGAGEIWKRHSLEYTSTSTIQDEFRKFKSIDVSNISKQPTIQVTQDIKAKGVYNIECPFSSDSD